MDYSWSTMDPNTMPVGGGSAIPGFPGAYSYGYGTPTPGMPMMGYPRAPGTFPLKSGIGIARGGGIVKKQWPKKKKVGPPAEIMTCPVCNVTCTGEQPWQTHLAGKKHKINEAKAAKNPGYVAPAKAPKVSATISAGVDAIGSTSVVGAEAANKILSQKINFVKPGETPSLLGQTVTTTDTIATVTPTIDQSTQEYTASGVFNLAPTPVPEAGKNVLKCDICNVTVNGQQPWDAHVNGAKHKKKVEEAANPGKIKSGGFRGTFRGLRGSFRPRRGGSGRGGRGGRGRGGGDAGMYMPVGAPSFFNYMAQ